MFTFVNEIKLNREKIRDAIEKDRQKDRQTCRYKTDTKL